MKVYNKQELYVEEFEANDSVTTCTYQSKVQEMGVACLVKSGEADGVFYDQCNYKATENSVVTLDADDYDPNSNPNTDDYEAKQYFWWTGATSGKPETGSYDNGDGYMWGDTLMKALTSYLKNLGITVPQGIHAGAANPEVISAWNSSH